MATPGIDTQLDISSVTISYNDSIRTKMFQDQLARSLVSDCDKGLSNTTFVCANDERLEWNGLAYLSSISSIFWARSNEEQHFTVLVPDYKISIVRKLLLLISTGFAIVKSFEVNELTELASDLGVSFSKNSYILGYIGYSF